MTRHTESVANVRYYFTFTLWHEPSVCRLSVSNVVAPYADLNFLAIFLTNLIA